MRQVFFIISMVLLIGIIVPGSNLATFKNLTLSMYSFSSRFISRDLISGTVGNLKHRDAHLNIF